jgi:hypothetical protein
MSTSTRATTLQGATPSARHSVSVELAAMLIVSAALLAARLLAAARVGFGDSEALYASYALHPQPAYLDHPGLIGLFARSIGAGTAPSPQRAHLLTSGLATLAPWLMALACRGCGASWRRSLAAGVVFALIPEIALGLFAMTPDLLMALSWICALALAALALRAPVGAPRATVAFAAAGLLAGVAAASKVTGLLLMASLGATYASRAARTHARTIAPWAGLAAGLTVIAPIVAFELRAGFPMLAHRLVDTQVEAGLSLRNLGSLIGGQLAYLSPLTALLALRAARVAWDGRSDAVGILLITSCIVPATMLVPLVLWSRVAEPHWIAPALLGLVPAMARAPDPAPRRLVVAAGATAGAMVAAVHAWVLVPAAVRLAPDSYDPRLDLTNELYGWAEVARAAQSEADAERTPGSRPGDVAAVGPHWVICAQLEAAFRGDTPVGCDTPTRDDFDAWWPRERWRDADSIIWVSDARFEPAPSLATYTPLRARELRIERAGRVVRTFTITVLTRRAQG